MLRICFIVSAFIILSSTPEAHAYVGPGAGFALISSFFALLLAFLIAGFTILAFPIRFIIQIIKRRPRLKPSDPRRVIVVGFDGMDPDLCKQYFAFNQLPHLHNLAQTGSFRPLKTTTPAISPVAWSTFATGVNPGKHAIFDFFTRDPRTYLPVLSSVRLSLAKKVTCVLGIPITIKTGSPTMLRKSKPFWNILGEHGIFSTILRVPITFPPEKFFGVTLSAMCTPDLLGTQGQYILFSNAPDKGETDGSESSTKIDTTGIKIKIELKGDRFFFNIPGPVINNGSSSKSLKIQTSGKIIRTQNAVELTINGRKIKLVKEQYSPWIKLQFKVTAFKKVTGIVRFLLISVQTHVRIYMTPINIDPERPSLSISHPHQYAVSLAKINGPFSTLGLSEDTNALNDDVISEDAFLSQSYDIFDERKQVFLDSLKKTKEGLLVSVFDTTDRIQHMFFRHLDPSHPANREKDRETNREAIYNCYKKMDDLVGEIQKNLQKNDLLMVISDHGFKPFRRGVNLNTWLWEQGYLLTKHKEPSKEDWFTDVDWENSKAFALGLAGIFINTKGREKKGIVSPGTERRELLVELKDTLEKLTDNNSQRPIRRVIISDENMKGPYVDNAPDLVIGYEIGYRTSWDCAVGKISEQVIEDNTRHWSGDHCIDPDLVPGVFFSNRPLKEKTPSLADLGPTILDLFGCKKQNFHDGNILTLSTSGSGHGK